MVFIVLLTGQALLQRYQSILNSRIQQRFMRSLRIDVYTSFMKAQWAFYLRQRKSDFSHVMTTELARVSQGTNLLLQLTTAVMFTMIQIALAFWLSPFNRAGISEWIGAVCRVPPLHSKCQTIR